MNGLKTMLLVLALMMATGCGTAMHFGLMNGEHYLGATSDLSFIDAGGKFGGSLGAVAVVLSVLDLPISLITDTLLIPVDYAVGRRKGFDIYVVDDKGQPVSGALIKGFSHRLHSGTTDKQGRYRWASDPLDVEWIEISKPLYYGTRRDPRGRHSTFDKLTSEMKSNAVYFLLERTVKPTPMIAKSYLNNVLRIPNVNQSYGFDVEKGDWVAPIGSGCHSDLVFRVEGTYSDYRHYDMTLSVGFSHDGDGAAYVPVLPCGLRPRPRQAPLSGYQPVMPWHKTRTNDMASDEHPFISPFMFRVRSSSIDSNDVAPNAYYGKLYIIDYSQYGYKREDGFGVKCYYYVNPVPNDRNLEFDPKQNRMMGGHEWQNNVPAP